MAWQTEALSYPFRMLFYTNGNDIGKTVVIYSLLRTLLAFHIINGYEPSQVKNRSNRFNFRAVFRLLSQRFCIDVNNGTVFLGPI